MCAQCTGAREYGRGGKSVKIPRSGFWDGGCCWRGVRQLRRAPNCYLQLHALREIALTRWRIRISKMRNFPKNTFTGLITEIRVVVVVIIIVAVGWRRRPSLRCARPGRVDAEHGKRFATSSSRCPRGALSISRETGVVFTARTWPRPPLIRLDRTRTDPGYVHPSAYGRGVQWTMRNCYICRIGEKRPFCRPRGTPTPPHAPGLDDFNYQPGVRKPVRSQAPFRTPSAPIV